ncbi:MAG: rod shape-determining protein MreD [Lachnospirales bacterium]
MRFIIFFILIFVNLIMQATIVQSIGYNFISPNTSIIIIISYAYLREDLESGAIGFISGLLQDVFFGGILGFYALLGFFTGYVSSKFFKRFYSINPLPVLFMVFTGTFFYETIFYFFHFLFRAKLNYIYYFNNIILIEMVYNVLITIPIYYFIYNIDRKLLIREKPKRYIFESSGDNNER